MPINLLVLWIGCMLLAWWGAGVVRDDGGPGRRRPRVPHRAPGDAGRSAVAQDAGVATATGPGPSATPTPATPPMIATGPDPREWHEILGVDADASEARILAAYRECVLREHPDLAGMRDPAQRARIEARLRQLEAACQTGLRARNS